MTLKILIADMTRMTVTLEDSPVEYAHLGGRALSSTLVSRLVPSHCDPLGPENVGEGFSTEPLQLEAALGCTLSMTSVSQ